MPKKPAKPARRRTSGAPTRPGEETFWSTVRRIGSSRKGVGAIIGTLGTILYSLAITVSYFLGKLTPDIYWTKLQVVGGFATGLWMLYIGGVAYDGGKPPAADDATEEAAATDEEAPQGDAHPSESAPKPKPAAAEPDAKPADDDPKPSTDSSTQAPKPE